LIAGCIAMPQQHNSREQYQCNANDLQRCHIQKTRLGFFAVHHLNSFKKVSLVMHLTLRRNDLRNISDIAIHILSSYYSTKALHSQ
jgi:hypothetical protein